MNFVGIKKLQREFGLSYAAAASLLETQRKAAMKRFRSLVALSLCGMASYIVLTFVDVESWHDAVHWIPLAMLSLLVAHLYLVNRASRASILAVAQKT